MEWNGAVDCGHFATNKQAEATKHIKASSQITTCAKQDYNSSVARKGNMAMLGASSTVVRSCWGQTGGNSSLHYSEHGKIPSRGTQHHQQLNWNIELREEAVRAREPARGLVDSLKVGKSNPDKPIIALGLGDPSGDEFRVPKEAVDAVVTSVSSYNFNGYAHSAGSINCRRAVADYLSADLPFVASPDDIFITPGCTQALIYCISALSRKGCNILIPRPAFSIYQAMCTFYGVQCRSYSLVPERGWEADLREMEHLADANTVAVIVCNPSNPCGSVYSFNHLREISILASKLKVPIISDEIYAKMVFRNQKFVPMATFASNAPVFTVGGISKRWFLPGWRLGWMHLTDPKNIFKGAGVMQALLNIAQINIGASSIIQQAVPSILKNTPDSFFHRVLDVLEQASKVCYNRASEIEQLSCPWEPQGAMYAMIKIHFGRLKDIETDVEFCKMLYQEESVIAMPGSCFGLPSWIRLQLAVSLLDLEDAWGRIRDFCKRHST